ncbi:MAG TPA: redox-regulated ATPase YchF [Candidatus Spyradosoma merdigallinarum]|uniref:Ribosome-binding ATPase YchF n=1 Tax=Candidatus Spyradosoma merdigallinarum TaxID=2840950 RepID=A0A9D1T102_9BACT|nr:redox-regulated ATPase YchF [Candidatus Spyradosoma merdigallinarum]
MLQAGIVGLPNVGKSTLFNALTRSRKAEAANYPFCTIEPNVGIVEVPDERLAPLAKIAKTNVIVPAVIEFVDIAGLVAGASKGEGLGNKFLSNIREVDAIVQVVRCFDDDDVIHSMGSVDPLRDIEVITTELVLADLQSCEAQLERNLKKVKGQDKEAAANVELLNRLIPHLNAGKPAATLPSASDDDRARMKGFFLLTTKPVLYACNVDESHLADPEKNPYVAKVRDYVAENHDARVCVICAQVEAELCDLSPEEGAEFLRSLGVEDSGVSQLIRRTYDLLGLASYFTAGEKEAKAWTFRKGMTAPQCAGVIHTDFEKGFIKAEVVSYDDLVAAGSFAAAREAGKYRLEGKDYLFRDGDVALFRFAN